MRRWCTGGWTQSRSRERGIGEGAGAEGRVAKARSQATVGYRRGIKIIVERWGGGGRVANASQIGGPPDGIRILLKERG